MTGFVFGVAQLLPALPDRTSAGSSRPGTTEISGPSRLAPLMLRLLRRRLLDAL